MDFTTKDTMVSPKGRVWVEVDLSQIEVRVLAALSNCGNYIRDLNDPDFDPHCKSGAFATGMLYENFRKSFLSGDPNAVEMRRKGKTISFEFQYGAAAKSIAERNKIPIDTVERYIRAYEREYPEVVQFHSQNLAFVNSSDGVLSINVLRNGYARHYPRYWKLTKNQYDKYSKNQIMNYPIQGISYDVNKLMWISPFSERIWRHRQVHDSILFSVPENEFSSCVQEIRSFYDTLQSRVTECLFDCPVILPYELKSGKDLTFMPFMK